MRADRDTQLRLFKAAWDGYGNGERYVLVAMDLEKVDFINHKILISQLGIRPMSNIEQNSIKFFLVSENKRFRNRFCAVDHNNFAFGKQSVISRQRDMKHTLSKIFHQLQAKHDKVIIVVWDATQDLQWLRAGAGWTPPEGVQILDLQAAYMAHKNIHPGRKPGLKTAMAAENVLFQDAHLHNAGNDAFYTEEMNSALGRAM